MGWEEVKQKLMRGLEEAKAKQLVDKDVIRYLDMINSVPECMTSSSCYGRILLIDVPTERKKDSKFIERWHKQVSFETVWDVIEKCSGERIWFKMEPLIIHISCKDLETAKRILKVKNEAGIKRGGIFSISDERVQIELEGTQRIALPVKIKDDVIVTKEYMGIVVDDANEKMRRNDERWKRFGIAFKKEFNLS
ncbi:MAG: hypothetical protein J7K68_03145 [Candidatus Diapherotrites archaeon]|nr:hypothetical protein [Candidatus Diapherotrites archaeon]